MKNEKGITLASLVITIIVLLIISSIAVYSGVGTIRYAKYNKAKSEMELMQANVNSWYEEYNNVEVKDEEIIEGKTKEEIKAIKQQVIIEKYGVSINDSSCDQTTLNKTAQATGITKSDYRFLSEAYLKDKLGMDSSFEFLVNIPETTVILFNGLTYNGKTYYTTDDFEILNVPNTPISSVTFKLAQGEDKEIIIYNLKFRDISENNVDISKFRVQYRKSTEEDSNTAWSDVTDKITKTTYNEEQENGTTIAYDGYKFLTTDLGSYEVRIYTTDKRIESNGIEIHLQRRQNHISRG